MASNRKVQLDIPDPIGEPKDFLLTAATVAGFAIVVGGMIGGISLLLPSVRSAVNRQGTGIGLVDTQLSKLGTKVSTMGQAG